MPSSAARAGRVVLVCCDDVSAVVRAGYGAGREGSPVTEVVTVDDLCGEPARLHDVVERCRARRVVVLAHWASDVVAGFALGAMLERFLRLWTGYPLDSAKEDARADT